MENKCTGCKTLISPYRTRCYKCQQAYHDAMENYVPSADYNEE